LGGVDLNHIYVVRDGVGYILQLHPNPLRQIAGLRFATSPRGEEFNKVNYIVKSGKFPEFLVLTTKD
jgi:hypothetical protein